MLYLAANPIFDSFSHSDLFGKAIFSGLFVLSVVTWTVFLSKWRYARDVRKKGPQLKEKLFSQWQNPITLEIEPSDHPYYRLFFHLKQETMEIATKRRKSEKKGALASEEIESINETLFSVVDKEISQFERNLFLLSTVVTLAPFLGLLGTVWGILLTFSELAKGSIANANAMVMNGLAMALGTTVVGLLVAIPALLSYNWHKSALAHFAADVEDFARSLLRATDRHFRKSESDVS